MRLGLEGADLVPGELLDNGKNGKILESERPPETELPQMKGQDLVEVGDADWRSIDSEREYGELPRMPLDVRDEVEDTESMDGIEFRDKFGDMQESERPPETELPQMKGQDLVEVGDADWRSIDSEREYGELPRMLLDVREGLTDEERVKIKIETGWSDEIIDAIGSWEEYEIYKNAGLVEAEIGGKKCLIRSDIDWNQKDELGRTNKERVEQGLSPINKDGKKIELHHIGQHADSPLAELTQEEHRGRGNDSVLHDKTKETEIDRQAFAEERSRHWEARSQESETGK